LAFGNWQPPNFSKNKQNFKMKKYKILALTALLAVFSTTSCKDEFLDVTPLGALSSAQLQNKIGVNLLLVGAYSLMDGVQAVSSFSDWQGSGDNWVYGEVISDNAHKGSDSNDQPEIALIETFVHTPVLNHFRGKWRAVYDGVARSNDVLQAVPNAADMSDLEKTQANAQARFLRGHYHFEAKKMFNMVPYIDEKIYNPADPASTKLSNDKDIWPNINDDLKFAYENLPATWKGEPGRATKWAAGALLGKAYMFQGKYAEAKTIFDAIVASGQYTLMAKYHDNFRAETDNNKESILEVQFSINDGAPINNNGNRGATLNYPYGGGVTTCCGFFQPSQNLVNAFKTDDKGLPLMDDFNKADIPGVSSSTYTGPVDPRLDWTVGRQGVQFLDWGLHSSVYIRDQGYAGPYSPKKNVPYKGDVGKFTTANPRYNTNNYRMIRYSHVLLMLAECEVEIGGLDKARTIVNQIRTRASNADGFVKTTAGANAANYKIGTYDAAWTDKDVARKAVRFETRLELAMEGHRYFDLVRWNVADKVMNDYLDIEQNKRSYLKGVKFVKGKHEYFPIPQNEILNSAKDGTATLKQNPGY
jgi:starch-binding outer membrane protein, SusD/RagB family